MSKDRMSALMNGVAIDVADLKHAEKLGITFGLHIGFGTYSHVYKAKYKSTPVALKVCSNTGAVCKYLVRQELVVFDILKEKSHTNIIQFFEKFDNFDSTNIWILMEWFEGMNMVEKLLINGAFEEREAKCYFKQVVDGLKFLHSLAVVHRDIKLDNILIGLIDGQQCIKIIDFGFAKKVDLKEDGLSAPCRSRLGTEVYMAPEMFAYSDNEDYDAFKSDIFSLAIVLYAFLYNSFPDRQTTVMEQPSDSTIETPRQPRLIDFPADSANKVSENAKQLILDMSCEDSVKRFNINQILDSKWMQTEDQT